MTPQELKNSILQLAIQGKLVEQRSEEGTAEELYNQIQVEKQILIKEGRIKKEKELPKISEDEILFDIPDSWKWVRLSEICKQVSDGTHKTPKYVSEGVKFISVKDISNGYLDLSNTKYISQEEHLKLIERCKPEKGDVLICRIGTLGKSLVIDSNEEFSIFVSLGLIKPIDINVSEYISLTINSGYGFSWIQEHKVGGGTHTFKINLDDLRNMLIPLPPLEEQKRIVAKIEEILPYIDKYEEAWTKLEEFNKKFPDDMQKSILQMAIQGKLVEQRSEEGTAEELYKQIQSEKQKLIKEGKIKKDKPLSEISEDEIPFDIPDSWKWVRLGSIGLTNIGLTYSPKDVSDDGTIVLRSSNIQNYQMDYSDIVRVASDIPENKMCRKGDILICARNGSKRLVGKAAIVDKDGMSFGAFMAIFRSVCNEYVVKVINSAYFRNMLLPDTGTTTVNQITQDMLKNAIIPIPPLKEQKRIVEKIEVLMFLCTKLK